MDEPLPNTGSQTESNGKTGDASIPGWIRNLGALVTIAAAVAGIVFTSWNLYDKAKADERTAAITLEGEKIKLQISREQLEQHREDREADFRTHRLDLDQGASLEASKAAKAANDQLAALISHMFANPDVSAEGDLAVLFNDLSREAPHRESIENAVLARLEAPRSREEIDLGVRLLERIGPEALEILGQANRSARRRYDDSLFTRFNEAFSNGIVSTPQQERPSPGPPTLANPPFAVQLGQIIASQAVRGTSLDVGYSYALLMQKKLLYTKDRIETPKHDAAELVERQELAAAVIERSSRGILKLLREAAHTRRRTPADLSATYLAIDHWPTGPYPPMNLADAYLEFDGVKAAASELVEGGNLSFLARGTYTASCMRIDPCGFLTVTNSAHYLLRGGMPYTFDQ